MYKIHLTHTHTPIYIYIYMLFSTLWLQKLQIYKNISLHFYYEYLYYQSLGEVFLVGNSNAQTSFHQGQDLHLDKNASIS